MTAQTLQVVSPLAQYLDEGITGNPLAARPGRLDGAVVGLLPNYRPGAVELLNALGQLIKARYSPEAVIMEPQVLEYKVPAASRLDDIAQRFDVVITASGD